MEMSLYDMKYLALSAVCYVPLVVVHFIVNQAI